MSQADWDALEENKQNIIKGTAIVFSWHSEDVLGIEPSLSEEEAIEVLHRFKTGFVIEDSLGQLEESIEEILKKRELH